MWSVGMSHSVSDLSVLERIAYGTSLSITNIQEFVKLSMNFTETLGFLEQLNVQCAKSTITPCFVRKSQPRITGTDR